MALDFDNTPYIPILGAVALAMGQLEETSFVSDAQAQANALMQVGSALGADAITVGWRSELPVLLDVARRVIALGRPAVALLSAPAPAAAREACEAGVAAVVLLQPGEASDSKFKQTARAAAHYGVRVFLADPTRADPDAVAFAERVGLAGAIITSPTGTEPGIVGGGLPSLTAPPRGARFFWSFAGEVPADLPPERLVALGERLASS